MSNAQPLTVKKSVYTLFCTVQKYLRGLQSHCNLPLVRKVPGAEVLPPFASEDHLRKQVIPHFNKVIFIYHSYFVFY